MFTWLRNALVSFGYQYFVKLLLFQFDPEKVHDQAIRVGKLSGEYAVTARATRLMFGFEDQILQQRVAGLHFINPVGLAAGFDKNGVMVKILPELGFGFAEVGSVTAEPCAGNPRPHLWRLKNSKSICVNYGLKNDGCASIAARLHCQKYVNPFVLGISIAKTNSPTTASEVEGIEDYAKTLRTFVQLGIGDYYTINISCPNAFGGESFSEPARLERLLTALLPIYQAQSRPILLKLAAELTTEAMDAIIKIARTHAVAGFVCSNLAKSRNNPRLRSNDAVPLTGGLSGKVVEELSNQQIAYIYRQTRGQFVIIGCGGIFSAKDAYKKIRLGASLIQLITGMIYQGPQVVSEINYGLVRLLRQDGFSHLSQAVGQDV